MLVTQAGSWKEIHQCVSTLYSCFRAVFILARNFHWFDYLCLKKVWKYWMGNSRNKHKIVHCSEQCDENLHCPALFYLRAKSSPCPEFPWCIYYPPTSHLPAISVLRSTIMVLVYCCNHNILLLVTVINLPLCLIYQLNLIPGMYI
jgi:hypothetical protein